MTFRIINTGYCLADESHLELGGRRGHTIQCPSKVVLFEHPRGNILFDTGYSAQHLYAATSIFPYSLYLRATPIHTSQEESVAVQLDSMGISPDSVAWIVVSHFHADHIAGLKDFPNASFIATEEGYEDVQHRRGWGALRRAFLPDLLPHDFSERLTLLTEFKDSELSPFGMTHDVFGDGLLRLVRLPGHARGQLGLLAQTEKGSVFLVGDAAYRRRAIHENIPPHPITHIFADDPQAVRNTLTQLHLFSLAHPDVRLYPTHCSEDDM